MNTQDFLKKHSGISFHMPGHKERTDFIFRDITEIYGADNLRNPTGIIKNSQEFAGEFLGGQAFYLVNGASSGLIASVCALGECEVLVDRNCHESVINGLIISGAMPKYIYPKKDDIFGIPKPVKLEAPVNEKAFIYTAVTYFGKVCDTDKIRNIAGENTILISDEAHGAHFYFSPELKKYRALKSDITVLSFHKSLPSLTQTAVMLSKNANGSFLEKCKNLITTTSPSYPLMASLDYAFENGKEIYKKSTAFINEIKEEIKNTSDILIYDSDDPWKILMNFKNCNSGANTVEKNLREKYNIFCEGVFGNNILFMISPYNTKEELNILKNAVILLSKKKGEKDFIIDMPIIHEETVITPREAFFAKGERVSPKASKGRISKENVSFFPPCIPIITAGEKISDEASYYLELYNKNIEVVK